MRKGKAFRRTTEVEVAGKVNIDGNGISKISTQVSYLNHMINILAAHSLIDITLTAKGDLIHHIGEDVAICLGEALKNSLREREGIIRFGHATAPLEDSLASASIDLAKRPYSFVELKIEKEGVEDMVAEDIYHFLRSLAYALEATIHIKVLYGENDHHKIEAAFKAFALALRQAVTVDVRRKGPPSTKGVM
jgi:imidazoleglycerol-phosphate dehydratase